jgi:hypothetical protein
MGRVSWAARFRPRIGDAPAWPVVRRDRIARQVAAFTVTCLGLVFVFSHGTQFLMPGPLSSAHGAIEDCRGCHAATGGGQLGWLKGLAGGAPHADDKACLTCHQMPETALNAHGAAETVLDKSTERLAKLATTTPQPVAARAQDALFPAHDLAAGKVACATCHQEHRGAGFDLKLVSNAQCRSCHVVKFESFDAGHPAFQDYPFRRRTRIAYDHAGHFGKHYPELAKKEPGKSIPATCSACHASSADRRVMAVKPFEQTCSTCHLDQITGKERASGPKGIAFLSIPGIDVASLRKTGAQIGEWPDESEAALTPFMKVMIGRSERGRAILKSLAGVNLQDLSGASADQIKAVTALTGEIKRLFHGLIAGKASEVLAGLQIGDGPQLGGSMIADLTANLPRDVIVSAQQTWLPNLAKEMGERQRSGAKETLIEHKTTVLAFMQSRADVPVVRPLRMAQADEGEALTRRQLPSGTPWSIEGRGAGEESSGARARPPAATPEPKAVAEPEPVDAAAPAAEAGPQTDELLAPTDVELREIKAREKGAPPQTTTAAPAATGTAAADEGRANGDASASGDVAAPRPAAVPVAESIESELEPENWADTGGWYRQDHAIYYRPVGHKDKFVATWLSLTGPYAPKGDPAPAAAVFDALVGKDAPGSCAKCHSIDDLSGRGRAVNFAPADGLSKSGHFTRFVHEPHFGLMEERGCLTCHALEPNSTPLKSYEQGDPAVFSSNFGAVKKDTCTTCHASGMARQDCGLCHAYHVNGVETPVMKTKIPTP